MGDRGFGPPRFEGDGTRDDRNRVIRWKLVRPWARTFTDEYCAVVPHLGPDCAQAAATNRIDTEYDRRPFSRPDERSRHRRVLADRQPSSPTQQPGGRSLHRPLGAPDL